MINARPTKEIVLPATGAKVVIKQWLTKREDDTVREPFMRNSVEITDTVGEKGKRQTKEVIAGDVLKEAQLVLLKTAIVSINESTERIVEKLYGDEPFDAEGNIMQRSDFDFLKKAIDDTLSPPKDQKA